MHSDLSNYNINSFNDKFNENKDNKKIMKAINKNGLNKFCINSKVIEENKPDFNIELKDTKRMNQKNSLRCWIYAGLNFVKRDMAQNLNIDVLDFELSPTFIAFYDRLEKANSFYNSIINKKVDLNKMNKDKMFDEPDTEKGRFELFRAIVNKYGIVPYKTMKDTKDSLNSEMFNLIFNENIRKHCTLLIKCKEEKEDLYVLKEKILYKDYEFLCKVIGMPPQKFNYRYTNLKNEKVTLKNITPLEFKDKFLKINLDECVTIWNVESYNKELYKKYRYRDSGNVYKKSYMEYINLPIERIKELVSMQLKDNLPVIFDTEILKFRDSTNGVLDTRLYDYSKYLPYESINRSDALNLKDIFARHVMNFTGVKTENGKFIRWKVEDSYGSKKHYNGYYIMNDNFFSKFVFGVTINKKYLNKKEINILNSTPIIIDE
ncbi:MAG: hypothetical protein IJ094_00600 [Bacilli bacterium]|nr:hypothetical protein [Bacilli bacterium]